MRLFRGVAGAAGWLLAWVLAVAVVAGVAWFAIDSAGREVGARDDVVAVAVSPPGTAPAGGRTGSATSPRTSPTRTPSGSGAGTSSTPGGDLTVRCAGSAVEGWAVGLVDGWRADAGPAAPGTLEAVFSGGGGRVVVVRAVCRAGGPVFSTGFGTSRP